MSTIDYKSLLPVQEKYDGCQILTPIWRAGNDRTPSRFKFRAELNESVYTSSYVELNPSKSRFRLGHRLGNAARVWAGPDRR